jgi:hypothetical protein
VHLSSMTPGDRDRALAADRGRRRKRARWDSVGGCSCETASAREPGQNRLEDPEQGEMGPIAQSGKLPDAGRNLVVAPVMGPIPAQVKENWQGRLRTRLVWRRHDARTRILYVGFAKEEHADDANDAM